MLKFKFQWSLKASLTGLFFVVLFLRLSYWQYERHQWKMQYIKDMQQRLAAPIVELNDLLETNHISSADLSYRRVRVSGSYDFSREILLRNRKYQEAMGVHAITPLKLNNSNKYILVNRGFIPLSKSGIEDRKNYQQTLTADFVGLVKASVEANLLAPQDPDAGPNLPWVERWLRVDIAKIQKQLPYQVLPFYLEIMLNPDEAKIQDQLIDQSTAGRDEMLTLTGHKPLMGFASDDIAPGKYPLAVLDTVIPPGRHFGYIFEWAILATIALLMTLVMQLKRR